MEIICFGDSITRGYDVPYGRGWVEICDASIERVILKTGRLRLYLIQRAISS